MRRLTLFTIPLLASVPLGACHGVDTDVDPCAAHTARCADVQIEGSGLGPVDRVHLAATGGFVAAGDFQPPYVDSAQQTLAFAVALLVPGPLYNNDPYNTDESRVRVSATALRGGQLVAAGGYELGLRISGDRDTPVFLIQLTPESAPTCADAAVDGDETDADCGGPLCPACPDRASCAAPTDCKSGLCVMGRCTEPPSCHDAIRNQGEIDVDCGGPCPACPDGKQCASPYDCASRVCTRGVCAKPTCDDHVRNGGESDVDCGGALQSSGCPPCHDGWSCTTGSDCGSHACSGNVCLPASCDDGTQDGDESAIDCGGTVCSPCDVGAFCNVPSDCASHVCANGRCATGSCDDGFQNDGETDVDCGGPSCTPCAVSRGCRYPSDCTSKQCGDGRCLPASCGDGARDGAESDVDCGGSCLACGWGLACARDSDCATGRCAAGRCATASCDDQITDGDEVAPDCGGVCGGCPTGTACRIDYDCASGVCAAGMCT